MGNAAIQVDALGRVFGAGGKAVTALADVSFTIGTGEIVALLGTNGAGKTTLVKVLSTLLTPTSGTARVLGRNVTTDVKEVRRLVGVVFGGDRGLYARLSGRENLRFFGMLAGVSRRGLRTDVPAMLERVGLADAADRRVETYSRGMRQRLHIAVGLLPRPQVLLLDEPTVGLDPVEADRLRDEVARLPADGVTVLLTSHYLLDVERLADRVVMLQSGRITADQSLTEFAAQPGYLAVVEVRLRERAPAELVLPAGAVVESRCDTDSGTELTLRLRSWEADVFTDLGTLLSGLEVTDVRVRPARLEEAYASMVARHTEVGT